MNGIFPLDLIEGDSGAFVHNVKIKGALGMRLRDLGFVKGTKVQPLFSGSGIRAYSLCGTVIALRDEDAAGVEVTYE